MRPPGSLPYTLGGTGFGSSSEDMRPSEAGVIIAGGKMSVKEEWNMTHVFVDELELFVAVYKESGWVRWLLESLGGLGGLEVGREEEEMGLEEGGWKGNL